MSITAHGIELPDDVEKQMLEFMKDKSVLRGAFTAQMLREGADLAMDKLKISRPENWSRRVVDIVLRREREAGNIDIFGARKGPAIVWRWIREDEGASS